jgi:hypothetical protein
MAAEPEDSLLETPTYVLAVILLVFQAFALAISWATSGAERALARRRRAGLARALKHMEHELMIVGLVTLVLIAAQPKLAKICVSVSDDRADWTMLSHVMNDGCPCCLAATKHMQPCLADAAGCGPDYCNCGGRDPACAASAAPAEARRRLRAGGGEGAAEAAVCAGAVTLGEGCPAGLAHAASFLALEQTHFLVFAVALAHVACSVALYLGALARLRWQWARWERRGGPAADAAAAAVAAYFASLGAGGAEGAGLEGGAPAASALPEEAPPAARRGALAALREAGACLAIGAGPRVVSADQFALMRASFLVTHRLGARFEFLEFVQRELEEDLARVVGLSLEFWLVATLLVLLAGPLGFPAVVAMPLIAACALGADAKLTHVVRAVTAGGRARRLPEDLFWLGRPRLLLVPIKAALFLISFLFGAWLLFVSSAASVAGQSRSRTCPRSQPTNH